MDDGFKAFYRDALSRELGEQLPPALLERYEVLSCLALSDHNEIYLVSRRDDGARGVLRISKQGAGEDALAEYEILKRLDHPGIPKAMDVLEDSERGYLVREYMEGQTLGAYVRAHGAVPEVELIDIACELCDLLSYLHAQTPPVIHRDIKPENIVIDSAGHLKLIDFGIARAWRTDATSDTIAIGTRPYMAAEQFGGAQTDARTDLYSLGIVMIYMATLAPDKTNLRHRFPYKRLLPVIEKCVLYDPSKRFQSARQLKRRLRSIQHGTRKKLLLGCAALVLAAAIGAGGFYLGQRHGYQKGYGLGNAQGLQSALPSGYDQGHKEGYRLGYSEGLKQIDAARFLQQDDSAPQYFDHSDTVVRGNTNANHINRALAATDGEQIYYATKSHIVRMDMEGQTSQVFIDRDGQNLNVYNGYLYFTGEPGLFRAKLDGDGSYETVNPSYFGDLIIQDDVMYVTNAMDQLSLWRMDPDGSNFEKLIDSSETYYGNIQDGYLYYSDRIRGSNLFRRKLDGGEPELLDGGDVHWINVIGDHVFYTDYDKDGHLMRCDLDGGNKIVFSKTTAAYTNVTEYGIFFANGLDDNRFYWMPLSGAGSLMRSDTQAEYVNVAGQWVFFCDKNDGNQMYRMRVDGSELTRVDE